MHLRPRSLNVQLVLLVSSILLATGVTSGWLTARKQSDTLLAAMRGNSEVMARSFSENAAHYLVLRDYAGLESFLLKSAELPDIARLQVCEPDGVIVGAVERIAGMKPRPLQGIERIKPPSQPSPAITSEEEVMIIWEPIEAGSRLGWIKATYSMAAIHKAQKETWRSSLLLALFWVGCSAVLLLLMLRPAVKAIGRLTAFAHRLDECKGDRMDAGHQAVEIEELGASLNYASGKLYSTEQELIHERERLRVTLRSIHDGVIAADAAGAVVFMNRSSEDLTGWSSAEALGRKVDEVFRLASPGERWSALMLAMERGAAVEIDGDVSLLTKDSRERPISGSASPIEDDNGGTAGMVLVFRDISERRQAEQRLALLNFALNNVRDEAYLINEQACFHYVNDQSCRALGCTREELLGRSVADVDPDFPGERWPEHWRDLRQRGSITFEGRHKTKAGLIYPVEISANYFVYECREYNLALVRDITERRRAEDELRTSNEILERIFNNNHTLIAYLDRDFNFLRVNEAYAASDGRPTGFFPGKNHFALYPDAGNEEIFRRVVTTGEPYLVFEKAFEYKEHPERGVTYWDWTLQPVKASDGHIEGLLLILLNVTDRKRAAQEKEKIEQQLRQVQKMEAIGTFAGGVAHDFNNILTAIIGYGTIVKMKMGPHDPLQDSIDQILSASERASHLTRGLLAFSRKQVINPKPADVNGIIRSMESLLRRLIGEDVDLSTLLSENNLIVLADEAQIEQVLMNLAANARDAMPEGGALTVRTDVIDLGKDFLAVHGFGKPGKYALITVSDTGQGMAAETQEKIFEPFFTTKEPGRGTGLGLAIVYGIVKQHEGALTVCSEPGKGTTFTVYLPLIVTPAGETSADVTPPPRGGTETILLAEDDPAVRNLTKTILTDFGYRVIDAVDGQDAIDKFLSHAPDIDLLLIDVIMPRKSGRDVYDAARAIRPGMRVVFSSGYTSEVIQKKGIMDEGLQFVSKPVSPADLLCKIREVLDKTP